MWEDGKVKFRGKFSGRISELILNLQPLHSPPHTSTLPTALS